MFSFSATDVYGLIIDQFQSRHILFGYSFNCFCFFVFFVFLFFCFFVFLFFCYFVFLFFLFFCYLLSPFVYLFIDVLPKTSFSPFWHRLGPL